MQLQLLSPLQSNLFSNRNSKLLTLQINRFTIYLLHPLLGLWNQHINLIKLVSKMSINKSIHQSTCLISKILDKIINLEDHTINLLLQDIKLSKTQQFIINLLIKQT